MKALWNNQVVAEADREALVYIEGNWYFPPPAALDIVKMSSGKDFSNYIAFWRDMQVRP